MRSTPTPHTKTGVTSKQIETTVGGGSFQYGVTVPEGTRCRFIQTHWVVADLSWLAKLERARMAKQLGIHVSRTGTGASIIYHDAHYRGITIDACDVTDVKETR